MLADYNVIKMDIALCNVVVDRDNWDVDVAMLNGDDVDFVRLQASD